MNFAGPTTKRSIFILRLLFVLVGLSPTITFAQQKPVDKPFLVFDATSYHGKPDLSKYGLSNVNMVYVSRFGEEWYKGAMKDKVPDEGAVRKVARSVGAMGGLTVIDIEHWSLRGDDMSVRDNIAKYLHILSLFRREAANIKVGYFGIVPVAAYGSSLKAPASAEYRQWQRENNRLRALANAVDAVFPYTYTYYPDQKSWVKFAIENIKEAKRYGKPVYVFLWPRYTENAPQNALQYIPADYWKLQLETVRQHADGIVIWGGWGDGKPEEWDENAQWWKVTEKFMRELHPKNHSQ